MNRLLLIVDDSQINLEIARAQCEAIGVECVLANDGPEAIQLAELQDFGMVLTDISMPGMDGMELARRLRGLRGAEIRIVGLTSNRALVRNAPDEFDMVLEKPLELGQLQRLLDGPAVGDNSVPAIAEVTTDANTGSEVVDTELLARLLGTSDLHTWLDWLTAFQASFSASLLELQHVCARQDRKELERLAHKAKGAARSAAVGRLSERLLALEVRAASEPWGALGGILGQVNAEFGRVVQYVATMKSAS